MERMPETVRSDKGKEFLGHKVQNLFKSHLIRHFVTQNEVKVNYAEIAIKTIKVQVQSYCSIDALQDITQAYNSIQTIKSTQVIVPESLLYHWLNLMNWSVNGK